MLLPSPAAIVAPLLPPKTVTAPATGAGGDRVVAAVGRREAGDPVDVGRVAVAADPVDVAAVADHDVVPVTGLDRVGVDPTEDDVGAGAGRDRIVAADQRLDRRGE